MSATALASATATAPTLADALELTLESVVDVIAGIRSLTFRDPHGATLPAFVPGSHVIVQCGTRTNAYSLTGSGAQPREYTVSVLRLEDGAGGSAAIHRLVPGDTVRVSRPRSAFAPVATARHHLLIAAGIGITPMLSHLRAAAEWGRPVSLLYSYRPGAAAHLDEVRALCGDDLVESTNRDDFRMTLHDRLRSQPVGTHLYICGPQGFTDTVVQAAETAGWPPSRLHSELFGATDLGPGEPFTVSLARSNVSLSVPSGVTLLEALEQSGRSIPNMCRGGICGECAVSVLRGTPQHRDLYLSDDEKATNDTMMCCVSRSHDDELELDL